MGMNYYFITKNIDLAHKYFAEPLNYRHRNKTEYINEEYELKDVPDFHYAIHLNKLSYGWKPLFQRHKCFSSFSELEKFYRDNANELTIKDEENTEYTWDEYKQKILDHANREPQAFKWIYDTDIFEVTHFNNYRKFLQTVKCDPEEADLWIPFDHIKYSKSKVEAQKRLGAWDTYVYGGDLDYSNDPDYPVDWVSGEFS